MAFEKTPTLSNKIDLVVTVLRIGMFFEDDKRIRQSIERAHELIDQGGDWDRRNRLRVHDGYYALT